MLAFGAVLLFVVLFRVIMLHFILFALLMLIMEVNMVVLICVLFLVAVLVVMMMMMFVMLAMLMFVTMMVVMTVSMVVLVRVAVFMLMTMLVLMFFAFLMAVTVMMVVAMVSTGAATRLEMRMRALLGRVLVTVASRLILLFFVLVVVMFMGLLKVFYGWRLILIFLRDLLDDIKIAEGDEFRRLLKWVNLACVSRVDKGGSVDGGGPDQLCLHLAPLAELVGIAHRLLSLQHFRSRRDRHGVLLVVRIVAGARTTERFGLVRSVTTAAAL